MATDKWLEFNGVEIVNLSRTAQLAASMGIDSVWITPATTEWIEAARSGEDYDSVTTAPWYDPDFPPSGEFAGVVPLGFPGLDDSTTESSTVEYVTDGGRSGKQRNATLPIVASIALIASTDRGAEYGKRWLDRILRASASRTHCSGADLRYYRYEGVGAPVAPPVAHRRQVRLTRGTSVTRKRSVDCSVTWLATFTLTCDDSYEYGEPVPVITAMGHIVRNKIGNPGFETGTDGWTSNGAVVLTRDTAEYHSGVASAKWVSTAAGAVEGVYIDPSTDPIDAQPNTVYSISMWVKGTAGKHILPQIRSVPVLDPFVQGSSVLMTGAWQRITLSGTTPSGTTGIYPVIYGTDIGTYYLDDVVLVEGPVAYDTTSVGSVTITGPGVESSGTLVLTEQTCPVYDYTPIYDPLHPALVASPTAPDFYPDGWDIKEGDTFQRFWTRVASPEPRTLRMVPLITLTTDTEARFVRVSIWPPDSTIIDQCDPLFSVIITYLPPDVDFIIDGEQKASYVWDGFSEVVRRADSLVYATDAQPVEWTAFNDQGGLLITLDLFTEDSYIEGDGDVRLAVSLVPKSD